MNRKMNKQEEINKLESKARKKGWLVTCDGHTEHPINQYLSKKDYKMWRELNLIIT